MADEGERLNVQFWEADTELYESLELAVRLIDALIDERPMLAAKMVGSTTLGNHRADLKAVVVKHRPAEPEGRVYGHMGTRAIIVRPREEA